jgi:alkaline phosphatase
VTFCVSCSGNRARAVPSDLPGSLASTRAPSPTPNAAEAARKNVILLLSDGTTPEAWTLARWVKGSPLSVDTILTGAVRTYGADSIVTDSAPGASAYATGHKGTDKAIAVGPYRTTIEAAKTDPSLAYVPLVTILEAARATGYATGLIATSNVQHATPAAFSAHVPDRNLYEDIAKQQVYQGIDVVLSGGLDYLIPAGAGGKRTDGEDLAYELTRRGYALARTKDDLAQISSDRVWGAFAAQDLAYELDRARFAPAQPSLAEMTAHAIDGLSHSPRAKSHGFFLFVEGSKVDYAAHGNDPVGVVTELLAFDAAVEESLKFARSNAHTQVVVVADHGTGGMSIGTSTDRNYARTDDDSVVGPLRKAKVTASRLAQLLLERGADSVSNVIAREWGIHDLSNDEVLRLDDAIRSSQGISVQLARIVSVRARIGWTTDNHTGADVYLFAYGPERPQGLVENTDIAHGIARFLGISLDKLQSRLFADLTAVLRNAGYDTALDLSNPRDGRLVVSRGQRSAILPFSKNWLVIDGETLELEGVVVHAEHLGKVFGPLQVLSLLGRIMP